MMDIEKIRGITLFISTLFNLFFAVFLWIKGKTKATFHLGLVAFFSAIYTFTFGGLYLFENKLFWNRATWLGVLILPAYITFVYCFTGRTRYFKFKSFFWYFWAVIFSYLALTTPYFITKVSSEYPYPEEQGLLEPVGWGYVIFSCAIGLFYILKDYFKSQGFRKLQLQYFILGMSIYSGGGILFAGILPLISPKFFPYIDLSAFLSVLWVGLTTYAILKKKLFDIKVILTELLVGIFSTLLLIQIFLSDSTLEYIWNTIIFVIFLSFGYLFIKSILKEIEMKQKIGEASWEVLEQGEKVSENFRKVMADREKLHKDWFLSDVNKELEINTLRGKVKELEEKLRERGNRDEEEK